MLQDILPFVRGVCVKLLHWLIPHREAGREKFTGGFFTRSGRKKKNILNNISAVLQRFMFSSVPLTKMKFLRSKCKAALHSPSRIVLMFRGGAS